MALSPLRDLEPRYDIKGGSPKTPIPPFSQSEYQAYTAPVNGSSVNRLLLAATTGISGLFIGALIAWFTALQNKGITRDELHVEMKEYRAEISQHTATTDNQIGEIRGKTEKLIGDLSKVQFQQSTDERDFTEFKTKTEKRNDLVADYLESQKTKK